MPRGWISRLKNHMTLQFAHDLPVMVFSVMVFAKKYFPTGSDKFLNIGVFFEKIYLQFVNSKKYTSGWKIYFFANTIA